MIGRTYVAGAGLAAVLLAMAFTPAGALSSPAESGIQFYGMAELVHRDAGGDVLASQTVHNRLVDTGEIFILDTIFNTDTAITPDSQRIDTICLTSTQVDDPPEDALASSYEATLAGSGGDPCKSVTEVILPGASDPLYGAAVIGPLTWQAGLDLGTTPDQTIEGVLVCIKNNPDGPTNDNCADAGDLFAAVDAGPFTPTGSETVDITYIFNMSSPDT
ncbi:hypothetical protein CENSYa_0906 [Cenarchaeum symbiosum A]|uniref:Uncharacterized protein n=1 Tax=Cenarchaeum symbiosum (strain A) TaxID=414004 RepID=A0RW21_CENSY|nr:hypothetical protein CENSYa_0906 [Cenarchaeum symbiosum A]